MMMWHEYIPDSSNVQSVSYSSSCDRVLSTLLKYFQSFPSRHLKYAAKKSGSLYNTFTCMSLYDHMQLCYEKCKDRIQQAFLKKLECLFCFPEDPLGITDVDEPMRTLWGVYEMLLQCTQLEKTAFINTISVEVSITSHCNVALCILH